DESQRIIEDLLSQLPNANSSTVDAVNTLETAEPQDPSLYSCNESKSQIYFDIKPTSNDDIKPTMYDDVILIEQPRQSTSLKSSINEKHDGDNNETLSKLLNILFSLHFQTQEKLLSLFLAISTKVSQQEPLNLKRIIQILLQLSPTSASSSKPTAVRSPSSSATVFNAASTASSTIRKLYSKNLSQTTSSSASTTAAARNPPKCPLLLNDLNRKAPQNDDDYEEDLDIDSFDRASDKKRKRCPSARADSLISRVENVILPMEQYVQKKIIPFINLE
ncbi:unnamed protein product, partial [Didymodactylos carnosus]